MWNWLKRQFRRSKSVALDRGIFSYFDGSRAVYADPLVLQRKLDEHGGDNWTGLLSLLKLAEAVDPAKVGEAIAKQNAKTSKDAAEQLVELVRKVFAVSPFVVQGQDEFSGLTDMECLDLLGQYLLWMHEVAAEARPSSSSSSPSESIPANSPTAPSSDSI